MNIAAALPLKRLVLLLLIMLSFDGAGISTAFASAPSQPVQASPTRVYFPDCGHYLSEPFLTYWRSHGRYGIGCPISEVITTREGLTAQYFNRFRLEYHPEDAGTAGEFTYGLIGAEVYNAKSIEEKSNPAYAGVAPFSNIPGRVFFPATGHSISFGMRDYWVDNSGLYTLGLPLSEEYSYFNGDKTYTAQEFERGRLLFRPETGVFMEALGAWAAKINGVSTDAVPQDGVTPVFSNALWEHWVDVNLSRQTAYFMEGNLAVRINLVTTGKRGHETPTGNFYINQRVYNEHMRGGAIGTEDFYDLDNVYYTQYFTYEGHALHYAWWRSQFGVVGSHGCVNMDWASSEFAWNWLGLGSRVSIHY